MSQCKHDRKRRHGANGGNKPPEAGLPVVRLCPHGGDLPILVHRSGLRTFHDPTVPQIRIPRQAPKPEACAAGVCQDRDMVSERDSCEHPKVNIPVFLISNSTLPLKRQGAHGVWFSIRKSRNQEGTAVSWNRVVDWRRSATTQTPPTCAAQAYSDFPCHFSDTHPAPQSDGGNHISSKMHFFVDLRRSLH